jgi:hypothetical protein
LKKVIVLFGLVVLILGGCSNRLPSNKFQVNDETENVQLFVQESQVDLDLPDELPTPSQESFISAIPDPGPQIYQYEVRAKIHETMPEYRFVASGEDIFVLSLEIYDEKDNPILSVSFDPESYAVYPEMMDTMGLHVTDVNFDGYKDVIILNCFHGAHSNTWYDCWLWNAAKSTFEPSKSFAQICNPALDSENKRIYSTGGSGAGYHDWYIYRFINGEFVVSNSLSFEYVYDYEADGYAGLKIIEMALKNGKLETVNEEMLDPSTTVDGTKYYNDEFWQLSHPRWYGVGGHHADQWLE